MSQAISVAEYRRLVAATGAGPKRKSKYGAKPKTVDGHRFPSLLEANRYGQLKLLRRAGRIRDLCLQVRFDLHGAAIYIADFRYEELQRDGTWRLVVEDTKGFATAIYKLKKRLFLQLYPNVDFREVK